MYSHPFRICVATPGFAAVEPLICYNHHPRGSSAIAYDLINYLSRLMGGILAGVTLGE